MIASYNQRITQPLRLALSSGQAACIMLGLACGPAVHAGQPPPASQPAPAWSGFANTAQHTGASQTAAQPLSALHWKVRIDNPPPFVGGALQVHYASPMITAANTVLVALHESTKNLYRIAAYNGATGSQLWSEPTDYTPSSDSWTPPVPATLTPSNQLAFAGAGGTVIVRNTPDTPKGARRRLVFYGPAQWNANKATYNGAVSVNTPITADAAGNLFFGFSVSASTPANLQGGIARIASNGQGSWVSAATAAADPTMVSVSLGSAPALSANGTILYVVVSDGSTGYLVSLDATTLAPMRKRKLLDPSNGMNAWLSTDSSASPTVGPDGDVYIGVLEGSYPQHDGRGWLLHFDSAVSILKTPGSFGWDTTASVVPASAIPGYKGQSSYLLAVKYNNYDGVGPHGDGNNRIAILDPLATQADPYSSATVMKEVQTALSPVQQPGASPGVRYEWCINAMVVDQTGGSIIANSEDGHVYRWDLPTNSLGTGYRLNAPQPEAYTPTVLGPDGTVYAINRATLYAIGK